MYFEAAAVITVLVLLGQLLEARARSQTGQAIRTLLGLAPKTAHRVRDSREEEVPVDEIEKGDVLRVRPGEKAIILYLSTTYLLGKRPVFSHRLPRSSNQR